MFTNKAGDGRNNLCGAAISAQRKRMKLSQRELAEKMQLEGIDLDKNAVQRIECGKRFVTDIELLAFSHIFQLTMEQLVSEQADGQK